LAAALFRCLVLVYQVGHTHYATIFKEKSPMDIGGLTISGGGGGLTRRFWVVFEENSFRGG
jgi:hypothetical protein